MNAHINILGGGPAGASAALAALAASGPPPSVRLVERSKFPRHKVCGEFLSPEIEPLLGELGLWDAFLAAGPARIRRMELHFGTRRIAAALPEPAWGLSRWSFDRLLLDQALARGAELARELPADERVTILAAGRSAALGGVATGGSASTGSSRVWRRRASRPVPPPRGKRLFGFKAHFSGPASDAVELYFFGPCYVGVNAVENGMTNVCGLAPEGFLGRFGFDYNAVVRQCPALARRLAPLERAMPWLSTGPLVFGQRFGARFDRWGLGTRAVPEAIQAVDEGRRKTIQATDNRSGLKALIGDRLSAVSRPYPAGDALSFVDPFTGSGLVAAVGSGILAGRAATEGMPLEAYLDQCRRKLRKPFLVSSVLRELVRRGWAERLAPLAPPGLLFALTRPR